MIDVMFRRDGGWIMENKYIEWKCPHCRKVVFVATPDKPRKKR